MNGTINVAQREYYKRPADERFPSLEALISNAEHDRQHSKEVRYNYKDLQVVTAGDTLKLASPKGNARFTHWSFGQLCRSLGAPASYLRELPPSIASDALNYGIQNTALGSDANILVKANGGEPIIRACTSDSYGRLWDAELYRYVAQSIVDRDQRWNLPPVWEGGTGGAYRGDRDSFLILTNGGSIVTDPTLQGNSGQMFRGILIRNSEVGASSVTIDTVLYRFICGNLMLWGAVYDQRFRRRHFGTNVLRDVIRKISKIAWDWTNQSASRDQAIIQGLIDHEVAHTKEAVVDELRKLGATKDQATEAYDRCERTESASPRSFWGMAQGLTRLSQDSEYQSERFELDTLASQLLSKGRKLVAA